MMARFGAALLLLAPALTGCGSAPPPPPELDLVVAAAPDINPDSAGAPRPVAVHLYQLAAGQKFANADVFALVEHEQATLGADDLGSNELVLKPSEKQEIKQPLKPGTTALGVVVWFQNIDNAQWRASAPVAASGPTKLLLDVGKLSVSLKPPAK